MDCCQCQGIETVFNKKNALKELKKYHLKGPSKTTNSLIDFLKTEGVKGKSLLDIGGGIGIIQHELLSLGVTSVINVEASTAYHEIAKKEAEQQGQSDKIEFHKGNFVDLSPNIPSTDIVTLDRVICCYPDMRKLVKESISHAIEFYAVVYPKDNWWVRLGFALINLYERVKRNEFRVYIHSNKEIHKVIQINDFRQLFLQKHGMWLVEIFQRNESNS
jgi:magnesium-protoporphyrin O-methyltransferase